MRFKGLAGVVVFYASDVIVALLLGITGGVIVFIVASSIPSYVSTTYYQGVAGLSRGYSEGDIEFYTSLVKNALVRAYAFTSAPIAVLASYTVGIEREQGYSLVIKLGGGERRIFLFMRVLLPWLATLAIAVASLILALSPLRPIYHHR